MDEADLQWFTVIPNNGTKSQAIYSLKKKKDKRVSSLSTYEFEMTFFEQDFNLKPYERMTKMTWNGKWLSVSCNPRLHGHFAGTDFEAECFVTEPQLPV